MATFHVELVSPEKLLFAGEAESATVPSIDGEMMVLANHAPLMAVLKSGTVRIKDASGEQRLFVRGGFADVNPEGLTILAEYAVPVSEIDVAGVEGQLRDAEEALRNAKTQEDKILAGEKIVQLRDLQEAAASR